MNKNKLDIINVSINNMKMLCAVIVIAIHCSLFIDVNEFLRIEFTGIIMRIAVPFFICVTGYYLTLKYSKKYVGEMISKLIKLYVFWTIFYLVVVKTPLLMKQALINGLLVEEFLIDTIYDFFLGGGS